MHTYFVQRFGLPHACWEDARKFSLTLFLGQIKRTASKCILFPGAPGSIPIWVIQETLPHACGASSVTCASQKSARTHGADFCFGKFHSLIDVLPVCTKLLTAQDNGTLWEGFISCGTLASKRLEYILRASGQFALKCAFEYNPEVQDFQNVAASLHGVMSLSNRESRSLAATKSAPRGSAFCNL
ncbi:hypothetical protein SAMN05428964_11115 [Thalassospira xiamenensis]|uniref:Uncharacterized protein n=1 Tax=Thalassospira xiamenensis TaxID=220697 RepID=A0A285TXW5_9PROT|nr:hypothetical protein SAMN05428964_11115 [Thalassospira xiamenensis]